MKRAKPFIEVLESRVLLSISVTQYQNNNVDPGVNQQESELTSTTLSTDRFGKQYTVAVDGAVYAEPLTDPSVTIAAGANTTAGSAGTHDVVYVATANDSIYAIDSSSGMILWQRSFIGLGTGRLSRARIRFSMNTTT
jgi:hypothetical protein